MFENYEIGKCYIVTMSGNSEKIAVRVVDKDDWEGLYKEALPVVNCYFDRKMFLDYTTKLVREISTVEFFINMIIHRITYIWKEVKDIYESL